MPVWLFICTALRYIGRLFFRKDTGRIKERYMLILTRRVGETVMIGHDVVVTVLGIKGNQLRVGVGAPKEIAVHREEVYERIKAEAQARKLGSGRPE